MQDRAADKRRRTELQHARQVVQASRPTSAIRYVQVAPPQPEILRVLFVTANPEAVERTVEHPDGSVETTGVWLRVDYEVRQVREMLKKSKYRELVTIEQLPAATTYDLLEGLNEHREYSSHWGPPVLPPGASGRDREYCAWGPAVAPVGATRF